MRIRWTRYFTLLVALALSACGGGGSSEGSSGAPAPATVGVLITDAPVGRWDEAIATITSVKLIGDAGQVTLFSGEETLDLLELGDFSELFAVADDVPAGSYSKIRLQVTDLVLRDLDDSGALIEEVRPKLVGNGKIDLNPRGSFDLAPGDVVFVELDFDMEKSLKITETGNGKLIIRPVIFVNIRTAPLPDSRLTRIHGEITAIDAESGDLRLCQTGFASDWEQAVPLQEEGPPRCVTVSTDEATGIFGEDGLPQAFSDLEVGEEVTAIGRLRPLQDEEEPVEGNDEAADLRLVLDAFVIEEGPLGTYRRIRGVVDSPVDSADQFTLSIAAGQGITTDAPLPVQLYEGSRIFNRAGDELAREDIAVGRRALVDGVLAIGAQDVIRSPLVILGVGESPDLATLEGEILTPDPLVISTATGDRCVDADDADIFLIDDSDGFSTSRGDLDDLRAGQAVAVFGVEDSGGCVVARTLLVEQ